jgi:hypothetical protein
MAHTVPAYLPLLQMLTYEDKSENLKTHYCPPKFKFRVGLEVLMPVIMIDIHSQTFLRRVLPRTVAHSPFGAEWIGMKSTKSFKLRSIMMAGMVTGVERVA